MRRALDALFREARRLERQRRRRYAAALLLLCVLAGGGGLLLAGSGRGLRPGEHRAPPLVSSLELTRSGDFLSIATVDDHVVVSGGPTGSLFPSGVTTLSDDRAVGTCDAATIAAGSLKLSPIRHGNCGDPELYGEQVLAISYLKPIALTHGIGTYGIRIAHSNPSARDGYTLGPVVMTYPQCSDCQAQWIYGDNSLWLYAAYQGGSFHPRHGELLRVSSTTGKVTRRWSIPQDPRELLAVDADGLWFAPSAEGGFPEHTPASKMARYESLYHVSPGAKAPQRVFKIPGGSAAWLVAAGHTVWLEARSTGRHPELWRVQRPGATPTYLGSYPAGGNQGADIGEAPPTHAGSASIGIYFVNNPEPWSPNVKAQQIIRLADNGVSQQVIARIRPRTPIQQYSQGPPAVALGHSFYFLDPALLSYRSGNRPPEIRGRGVLYRVTPRELTK